MDILFRELAARSRCNQAQLPIDNEEPWPKKLRALAYDEVHDFSKESHYRWKEKAKE